jgi:hypothetical protein
MLVSMSGIKTLRTLIMTLRRRASTQVRQNEGSDDSGKQEDVPLHDLSYLLA